MAASPVTWARDLPVPVDMATKIGPTPKSAANYPIERVARFGSLRARTGLSSAQILRQRN